MIRQAKFADIPRMLELMREAYARSRYARIDEIDTAEAKALLMGAIQRVTSRGEGACCAFVAQRDAAAPVEGYILGVLQRVYQIGKRLEATDLQFLVSPRADARDFIRLHEAFEGWAQANHRVVLIRPGITDVVAPQPERLGGFYKRRLYRRSGLIYEKEIER